MYHGADRPPGRAVGRAEVTRHRPDLDGVWDAVDAAFPVKITSAFWRRIDPTDPHDPLAAQVLPDPRELEADPADLADPVGDAVCTAVPWVIHKYPRRALFMVTKRCHLYCRYCFRRNHHPAAAVDPTPAEVEAALTYLSNAPIEEVILSGGDPLILADRRLFDLLDRLDTIPIRRIHTRAPITLPSRITARLVDGLAARSPVWVVVHCNHPAELDPQVDRALASLVDAGIPVLNQAVLLKGVNDDADVLACLCEALVRRRVFPYYLHLTDRAAGNAHLRVDRARSIALHDALRRRVSGVALPRLVFDPPDGSGKVDAKGWTG